MKASKLEIDTILLSRSVKHYQDLMNGKSEPHSGCCPLCNVYLDNGEVCNRCPIKLKTGKDGCEDTPWRDAMREWEDNQHNRTEPMYHNISIEYRFLLSLYKEYANKIIGKKG